MTYLLINGENFWYSYNWEYNLAGPYLGFESNLRFSLFFGHQGQCLGMKWLNNWYKRIAFAVVVQSSTVNPLVGSKPSLIKHLTVPHPDVLWAYRFLKFVSGWFNHIHTPLLSPFVRKNSKIFNIWCI